MMIKKVKFLEVDKMINDVIQFNENHKWRGCLGIITEKKEIQDDIRYMIAVPMPQQGTAFIYVLQSEFAMECIGRAVLTPRSEENE